jgi:hypothetical protein
MGINAVTPAAVVGGVAVELGVAAAAITDHEGIEVALIVGEDPFQVGPP